MEAASAGSKGTALRKLSCGVGDRRWLREAWREEQLAETSVQENRVTPSEAREGLAPGEALAPRGLQVAGMRGLGGRR